MSTFQRTATRLFIAAILIVASSCDSSRTAPLTGPTSAPRAMLAAGDADLAASIRSQIDALFTDLPRRQQAHQHFDQTEAAWMRGDVAGARNKVYIIETHTLDQLGAGMIADIDGGGPETATSAVILFFNDLRTYVGLSNYIEPAPGAFITLLSPSADTQVISTGLEATIVVPGNATSEVALLYVARDTSGADIGAGLPTASDLYEVRLIPAIEFTELTVGLCIWPPMTGARLAHRRSATEVDILALAPINIPCLDPEAAAPAEGMLGRLAWFARKAASVFAPTVAYAGHAAISGTVADLSPFQVVITATSLSATADGGVYGGAATVDATLSVTGGNVLANRPLELLVDGTSAGTATTDAYGKAHWSVPGLNAGDHAYSVAFAGDPDGVLQPSGAFGTFTVARASLTLTASSADVLYGASLPACVVTYSGLVNGDTPATAGLGSTCTYAGLPLGTSIVLPTAVSTTNYAVAYVGGTFRMTYNSTVGHYFSSPLPMREIRAGSKVPVKFQLFMADGVTPVTAGTFTISVSNVNGGAPLGVFTYKASANEWYFSLDTSGFPLGVQTIIADLGDGSAITVQEIIK